MVTDTILVTGATGNIGSALVPLLAARSGCVVRAMSRNPGKHADTFASAVQLVAGNFENEESLHVAMRDVDSVILIAPPSPDCVRHNRAIFNAALQSGVRKIVRISAIKASEDGKTANTRLHGECDTLLKESGLVYTILRPNYFMQNILMSLGSIEAENCFFAGMGDGKLAMIDVRDVAECAATAAMSGEFEHSVFEISGPKSVSFSDVASVLSEIANRPISYNAVSPEDVEVSLLQMGFTDWMATLLREYSAAYGEGWGDLVTDNVDRLTGHPPRSFRQYATDCLGRLLN